MVTEQVRLYILSPLLEGNTMRSKQLKGSVLLRMFNLSGLVL